MSARHGRPGRELVRGPAQAPPSRWKFQTRRQAITSTLFVKCLSHDSASRLSPPKWAPWRGILAGEDNRRRNGASNQREPVPSPTTGDAKGTIVRRWSGDTWLNMSEHGLSSPVATAPLLLACPSPVRLSPARGPCPCPLICPARVSPLSHKYRARPRKVRDSADLCFSPHPLPAYRRAHSNLQ